MTQLSSDSISEQHFGLYGMQMLKLWVRLALEFSKVIHGFSTVSSARGVGLQKCFALGIFSLAKDLFTEIWKLLNVDIF